MHSKLVVFYFSMTLKICAWNVRGLNDLTKQREVANIFCNEGIDIVDQLETKVLSNKHKNILNRVVKHWKSHTNNDNAALGWAWVAGT